MALECFRLNGKIAVITGGAGLLGRAHAEALIESEARVILLDTNQRGLQEATEQFGQDRCEAILCDITREEDLELALKSCVSKFSKAPDILINNAAIDPKVTRVGSEKNLTRLENFPLEQWDMEVRVGLSGAFLTSKVFGAAMARAKSGVILNIASDLGIIAPDQRLYEKPGLSQDQQSVKPITYSVIKHGLLGLTKYLATYWGAQGVRCNAFAPGGVFNDQPEEFVKRISQLIPLGRMARKDEYKGCIVFLCSDASSYLNGSIIVADGGRSVW